MTMEQWNDIPGTFHPACTPDFLPLPQLRELQLQRLQATVRRAYEKVPLYRKRFDEKKITPEAIRRLADIDQIPFTVKADLRDTYPFGLFASPMNEIVRLHASSGTTGKPIVVAYTREDIDVWSNVMLRSLAACGLHQGDIVQNAYGYGLFTGGLGLHYGAEALGATVIPISGGNTDRQIMIMKDFGVTAITCTPSYFIHLIERAGEMGVKMKDLPLKVGVFGAEPWSESMRRYIIDNSNVEPFDIYGLSEIVGPGVGIECSAHHGLHIFEDHFYPEIIHPETGEVLPEGKEGELVLTTLSKKAMPMLRYRTRDITTLAREQCACGRTICRFLRVGRRSDDMFIIRGINVFPSQVEHALLKVEGTLPHYQIVLTRDKGLDKMEVQVEVTPEIFADTVGGMEALQKKIAKALDETINLNVAVKLVEPHSIPRSEGKAKRVLDQRKM
jgi:phenylacetate-CoA ligase